MKKTLLTLICLLFCLLLFGCSAQLSTEQLQEPIEHNEYTSVPENPLSDICTEDIAYIEYFNDSVPEDTPAEVWCETGEVKEITEWLREFCPVSQTTVDGEEPGAWSYYTVHLFSGETASVSFVMRTMRIDGKNYKYTLPAKERAIFPVSLSGPIEPCGIYDKSLTVTLFNSEEVSGLITLVPKIEHLTENGWEKSDIKPGEGFCGTPDSIPERRMDVDIPLDMFSGLTEGFYRISFDGSLNENGKTGDAFTVSCLVRFEESANYLIDPAKILEPLDSGHMDIDADGIAENYEISYGPTSGLFTFRIIANAEGEYKYNNTYNSDAYDKISFEQTDDGRVVLAAVDFDGNKYVFDVKSYKGNLLLINQNGAELEFWGPQGVENLKQN